MNYLPDQRGNRAADPSSERDIGTARTVSTPRTHADSRYLLRAGWPVPVPQAVGVPLRALAVPQSGDLEVLGPLPPRAVRPFPQRS